MLVSGIFRQLRTFVVVPDVLNNYAKIGNIIFFRWSIWWQHQLKLYSIKRGCKISAQPHTIVKQIFFPNGNVLFMSLFPLSKNWMHNVVWGCAEIYCRGKISAQPHTTLASNFFQTWKLSLWKPHFCLLITHSFSNKPVLRRIQYFIIKIWCIGYAQKFNLTEILWPIPTPTNNKMLGESEKK